MAAYLPLTIIHAPKKKTQMITNPDGVSGKKLLGHYLIYLWRFSPGLRTANIFTSFPQSFFFFVHTVACDILLPWLGVEPGPSSKSTKSWPLDHQGFPPQSFLRSRWQRDPSQAMTWYWASSFLAPWVYVPHDAVVHKSEKTASFCTLFPASQAVCWAWSLWV